MNWEFITCIQQDLGVMNIHELLGINDQINGEA